MLADAKIRLPPTGEPRHDIATDVPMQIPQQFLLESPIGEGAVLDLLFGLRGG